VKRVLPSHIDRRWLVPVLALALFAGSPASGRADETAILHGRVLDARRLPLPAAVVTVEGRTPLSVLTDEDGAFALAGLAAGTYAVRVESPARVPQRIPALIIEPAARLYLRFVLQAAAKPPLPGEDPLVVDESPLATRTTISAPQIENLPSAHSLWSLIENQDFSATTDRIDVGGLWETRPAMFSARGATSWTQNVYRLNGMDVSDPYTTGRPLFVPDVFSLAATQMSNADHPASAFHPGGLLDLIPRDTTPDFRCGFSGYYTDKSMSASNITPAIRNEGLTESHTLNNLTEFNLHFSGPISGPALQFFASATSQSVNRNTADFDRDDTSLLYSGLVQVRYERPNSVFRFFWTGQAISDPTLGAGRSVPFASTVRRSDASNIVQITWETPPRETHRFRAGFGYAGLRSTAETQSGFTSPQTFDLFTPAAAEPRAGSEARSRFAGWFEGESFFSGILGADHLLEYGIRISAESAASRLDVREGIYLYTFNGLPAQIAFVDAPREERETGTTMNFFARETLRFGRFALFFGANLGLSRAGNSAASVRWTNLAPHFGLDIPVAGKGRSRLRLSAARYYFTLPLSYLAYGNPDAPGLSVHAWTDLNRDGAFQAGEEGPLLRREGPLYGAVDPAVKRPYTDELAAAWISDFGHGWTFTLAGFQRETRNLVATANTGVPASDYTPLTIRDDGDDRIPGSYDDLTFTVYDQNPGTLGKDFYLLSNPGGRVSRYVGLDLTLVKRAGPDFLFYLALTATHAVAVTNPGNTEYENDEGVLGALFENPNAAINAKGRPRFDRAYTGRIGISFKALLGTRIGAVVKYYDGQPFARKIVVPDLNQGLIYIQAHPRGVSRYEYNMTVDLRIEKDFTWKQGALRLFLDGFNVLNRNLATAENEWTGPSFPFRYATEIQSPRVVRLGLNFEF
jgi:hypothetical protein